MSLLTPNPLQAHNDANEKVVKELKLLADRYDKVRRLRSHHQFDDRNPQASPLPPPATQAVIEEQELSPEKRVVANVGKTDARKHLASNVNSVMASNINQALGTMLDTVVF